MNTNKQKIIEKITEQIKPLIKENIMEGFKLKTEDAVDTAMKKTETGPMERGLEILRKKVELIPGAQKKSEFILQIMPKMGIDAETLAAIANRVKTGAKQAGRDGEQQAAASDPAATAVSAELES